MQGKARKIVYSDDGRDIGLTGVIVGEDDFFIEVLSHGKRYRVGKKAIIVIKDDWEAGK